MQVELLKCKIHRAAVTSTNLDYQGSITISGELKRASGLLAYEKVSILNVTTGARFDTYVIPEDGEPGEVTVNGAAARLAHIGDILIIVSYGLVDLKEAANHQPVIVQVGPENRPI